MTKAPSKSSNVTASKRRKAAAKKAPKDKGKPKPVASSGRPKRGAVKVPKSTPPQMEGRNRTHRNQNPTTKARKPPASASQQVDDAEEETVLSQSPAKFTRSQTVEGSPNVESANGSGHDDNDNDDNDDDAIDDDDDDRMGHDNEESAGDEEDDDNESSQDSSNGSGEDNTEPTLMTDSESTRKRVTSAGEDKYWMATTRKRVADCKPSKTKTFMLYLPLSPETYGSTLLIENDLSLQEMALTRGGPAQYAIDRAFMFNQHHRKAKTQLNRSIVMWSTAPNSDYMMALNVMDGKLGPMTLNPALTHLGDIEGLQQLLNSDCLYKDEVFHKLWVGLFASGLVFGMKRAGPKDTLDKMIDIDYETHARYEMISRLSCQGFRHGYKAEDLAERARGFRHIRKKVRKDRLDNLKAAEAKRLVSIIAADNGASRTLALGSGGLDDTTDEEDDF
jgi:hypothetical protein